MGQEIVSRTMLWITQEGADSTKTIMSGVILFDNKIVWYAFYWRAHGCSDLTNPREFPGIYRGRGS